MSPWSGWKAWAAAYSHFPGISEQRNPPGEGVGEPGIPQCQAGALLRVRDSAKMLVPLKKG